MSAMPPTRRPELEGQESRTDRRAAFGGQLLPCSCVHQVAFSDKAYWQPILPTAYSGLRGLFARLRRWLEGAHIVIAPAQLPPANPQDVGERRAAARQAHPAVHTARPGDAHLADA